jgi:hypothetical protein
VLQNLGTIYADDRYDHNGDFLNIAQSLFEQTKALVPRDYYQYEKLAVIHRRKAQILLVSGNVINEIANGQEEANNALKYRPNSRTALIESARLAGLSWQANG